MKNKVFTIITISCFTLLSTFFVFLPSLLKTGVVGTYYPRAECDNPAFLKFELKANNVVNLTYSNNLNAEYKWYAKCNGEWTAIYFVFSKNNEIQFNLLESRELKDIYHNGDIYYKQIR